MEEERLALGTTVEEKLVSWAQKFLCRHSDVERRLLRSCYGPCLYCEDGTVDLVENRRVETGLCSPGKETVTNFVVCNTGCNSSIEQAYYDDLTPNNPNNRSLEDEPITTKEQPKKKETETTKPKQQRSSVRFSTAETRYIMNTAPPPRRGRSETRRSEKKTKKKKNNGERKDQDDIINPSPFPVDDLEEIAEVFRKVVAIGDHTYHLRTYQNCFIGSEAVSQLVGSGTVANRNDAVALGRRLEEELDLFSHVARVHGFEDKHYYYRLNN